MSNKKVLEEFDDKFVRKEPEGILENGHLKINEVHQGDCLELMKLIPDKSIDAIISDLPYGTTACHWDTIIPFEPLWEQYKRIIKDNGAIVLTASQPFTSALVMSNIKMFKYEWVWDKVVGSNIFQVNYAPLKTHENILVFGNGKVKYNPQKIAKDIPQKQGRYKNKSDGSDVTNKEAKSLIAGKIYTHSFPKTIQTFIKDKRSTKQLHPTQKPVALFEYLIKTYTNEGDLVLDNCAGSGTTGVACKNLNRNYILIEKEPEYIKICEDRIKAIPESLF
jgi:site-specific DNA-methyltransferase (adenine-specific)